MLYAIAASCKIGGDFGQRGVTQALPTLTQRKHLLRDLARLHTMPRVGAHRTSLPGHALTREGPHKPDPLEAAPARVHGKAAARPILPHLVSRRICAHVEPVAGDDRHLGDAVLQLVSLSHLVVAVPVRGLHNKFVGWFGYKSRHAGQPARSLPVVSASSLPGL